LRAERAANVRGAELLGFRRTDEPLDGLRDGDVLLLAGVDLDATADISKAAAVVAVTAVLSDVARSASAVLPIANMSEEDGSFTNLRGRVQRFRQAKSPPGLVRASWSVLADLLLALGDDTNFFTAQEVFASLASSRSGFSGLDFNELGFRGLPILETAGATA
jgi:NADH-quinone oxidoreductase subunit G